MVQYVPTSFVDTEAMLNERVCTGDRQALLALYEVLQERIIRRATRYEQDYRQSLPWYLDAQDLAQEASLAMYQRLEEAPSKDRPIAYLVGTGYAAIRYACIQALHEPRLTSLDRPCSEENPILLHELIPAPTTIPASVHGDDQRSALLSQAVASLPPEQRALLAHRLGLDDQPTGTVQETARWLGLRPSSSFRKERKAYATLFYRLAPFFPHAAARLNHLEQAYTQACAQGMPISAPTFAQAAGIGYEEAMVFLYEREGAPCQMHQEVAHQHAWQRLKRVYNEQLAQGRTIGISTLARRASADYRTAQMYFLEREGTPRLTVQQRLEQAYTDLHAQSQAITVSALARQAGTQRNVARKYLRTQEGAQRLTSQHIAHQSISQRLEQAYTDLHAQSQVVAVSALARQAGTSRTTARKYLREQEVRV